MGLHSTRRRKRKAWHDVSAHVRYIISPLSLPADQEDSIWYTIYGAQDSRAFIS